jgi:RNA polymerase sigma-70 factor (ECF subfamily)
MMENPKLSQDEDALAMERFVRTRDRRMFEVLFQKYKRPVLAHVMRFVRDQARAEELTQDVFIRVYTTKKYEATGTLRTWLYRVATNVCLNELRKAENKAHHESLDAESSQETKPEPLSTSASPEEALAGNELAKTLQDALTRLPANQRAALLMARQDGMTHEEIATALETSVPAVKSLIHRALETLRKEAERLSADASQEATL